MKISVKVSSLPFRITLSIGFMLLLLAVFETILRLSSDLFSLWNLSGIAFSLGFLSFWTLLYKKKSALSLAGFLNSDVLWIALLTSGSLLFSAMVAMNTGSLALADGRHADLWKFAMAILLFGLSLCVYGEKRLLPGPSSQANMAMGWDF